MFIGGLIKAVRRKVQQTEEQENLPASLEQKRRKKSQKSRQPIQEGAILTNNAGIESDGNEDKEENMEKIKIITMEPTEKAVSFDCNYEQQRKLIDGEIELAEEPMNRRRFSTSAKGKFQVSTQQRIEKLKERFRLDASESELIDANLGDHCCVCLFRSATVRTYPCGHQVFCRLCAITLIQSLFECGKDEMRCSICRAGIAALRHQKKAAQKCENVQKTAAASSLNNRVNDIFPAWRRHWRSGSAYRKRTRTAIEI